MSTIDEKPTVLEQAMFDNAPVTVQVDDGRSSSFEVYLLALTRKKRGEAVRFSVPLNGDEWRALRGNADAGASILIAGLPAKLMGVEHNRVTMTSYVELKVERMSRAEEKEASREADERALANGATPADIERKNAFITADRTNVHWDKSKPL